MRTIGVERERFIIDASGNIIPAIGDVLPKVHELAVLSGVSPMRFSYELFAGQIEDRTPPCENLEEMITALEVNNAILNDVAQMLAIHYEHTEYISPQRITRLIVNSFDERHQIIWNGISQDRRIAASIVAGIHVHVRVDECEVAQVLNVCRESVIHRLCCLGDHSQGKRLQTYKTMSGTHGEPPLFPSFQDVMTYIREKGGEKNVWDLVRYKPSTKTIEFRMFGATPYIDEIIGYVQKCLDIVENAIAYI